MPGSANIPYGFESEDIEELRDKLAEHGIEVSERDPYAKGGPGPQDIQELVQGLSMAYSQIFGSFRLLDFVRDYAIGKAALDPLFTYLAWLSKKWRPHFEAIPMEIDLGEQLKIKLRITLEGAPNEQLNSALNSFVEAEVAEKLLAGDLNHRIVYARWNPKDGSITKHSALQIEGLEGTKARLMEALEASKNTQGE